MQGDDALASPRWSDFNALVIFADFAPSPVAYIESMRALLGLFFPTVACLVVEHGCIVDYLKIQVASLHCLGNAISDRNPLREVKLQYPSLSSHHLTSSHITSITPILHIHRKILPNYAPDHFFLYSSGIFIPTLLALNLTLSSSSMPIPGLYLSNSVAYIL